MWWILQPSWMIYLNFYNSFFKKFNVWLSLWTSVLPVYRYLTTSPSFSSHLAVIPVPWAFSLRQVSSSSNTIYQKWINCLICKSGSPVSIPLSVTMPSSLPVTHAQPYPFIKQGLASGSDLTSPWNALAYSEIQRDGMILGKVPELKLLFFCRSWPSALSVY